jgi:hypothetical protein
VLYQENFVRLDSELCSDCPEPANDSYVPVYK